MAFRSRQRVAGGGKFRSERQRRAIWAASSTLGHLWAHNMNASGHRSDWARVGLGAATHKSAPTTRLSGLVSRPTRRTAGRSMGVKGGGHTRSGSFKR